MMSETVTSRGRVEGRRRKKGKPAVTSKSRKGENAMHHAHRSTGPRFPFV